MVVVLRYKASVAEQAEAEQAVLAQIPLLALVLVEAAAALKLLQYQAHHFLMQVAEVAVAVPKTVEALAELLEQTQVMEVLGEALVELMELLEATESQIMAAVVEVAVALNTHQAAAVVMAVQVS